MSTINSAVANVSNKAGDKTEPGSRAVAHSLNLPTVSISAIAGDDVINGVEDDAPVLISGSTSLAEDGQLVSLQLNGKTYSAPVAANAWSLSLPALDAQALKASNTAVANVTNQAGDKAEPASRTLVHSLNLPTVIINTIAGDDVINSTEDDAPVLISGSTSLAEDGSKVSVVINGKTYEALVSNNQWSFNLPAADAQALKALNTAIANKF